MTDTIIIDKEDNNIIIASDDTPIIINNEEVNIVTTESENSIVTTEDNPTLVVSLEQGPAGPPGPPGAVGDEEVAYAKLVDTIDDDHLYIGEATPGTLESGNVWRIKYIVFTGNDISIRWANGSSNFDKVWDSRLSYTYL